MFFGNCRPDTLARSHTGALGLFDHLPSAEVSSGLNLALKLLIDFVDDSDCLLLLTRISPCPHKPTYKHGCRCHAWHGAAEVRFWCSVHICRSCLSFAMLFHCTWPCKYNNVDGFGPKRSFILHISSYSLKWRFASNFLQAPSMLALWRGAHGHSVSQLWKACGSWVFILSIGLIEETWVHIWMPVHANASQCQCWSVLFEVSWAHFAGPSKCWEDWILSPWSINRWAGQMSQNSCLLHNPICTNVE